ncbi:MAG: Hsp20/alpha crystallin family protein [Chloroflexi bacterium]|nr:Hsp20/alpha crystallin family protein [Chloroflexota bacterium]
MIRYSDPFQRTLPLRRLLDRMLEDMRYQQEESAHREPDGQAIPVNVFHTPDQIVLVAPMPGASPDDIEVSVAGDTVHLRAEFRGPHQEEKQYILREWTYGPYERSIQLPFGVDAERTNASFNNGVLVLNLPKRDVTRPHRVRLQSENSARGVQAVRTGHDSLRDGGPESGAGGAPSGASQVLYRENASSSEKPGPSATGASSGSADSSQPSAQSAKQSGTRKDSAAGTAARGRKKT